LTPPKDEIHEKDSREDTNDAVAIDKTESDDSTVQKQSAATPEPSNHTRQPPTASTADNPQSPDTPPPPVVCILCY